MLRAAAGNREPVVFNPANLFASGEFGGFYDFSDTSTLFTDQARTTPVTTTGNAVRGVTDLSGNNNHLINSLGTPTWNSAGFVQLISSELRVPVSKAIGNFTLAFAVIENVRQSNFAYAFVSGGSPRFSSHLAWTDNKYYFDTYDFGSGRVSGTALSVGTPFTTVVSRTGSSIGVTLNNSAFGTATQGTSVSINQINFGYGSGYYWNGSCYALFFIDRALTTTEKSDLQTWLTSKL